MALRTIVCRSLSSVTSVQRGSRTPWVSKKHLRYLTCSDDKCIRPKVTFPMFLIEEYFISLWGLLGTLVCALFLHLSVIRYYKRECIINVNEVDQPEESVATKSLDVKAVEEETKANVIIGSTNQSVHFGIDVIVLDEEAKETDNMDTWTRVKETLERDRKRVDHAINWLKGIFMKKAKKGPTTSDHRIVQLSKKKVHSSGPVHYTATYQTKSMVWQGFHWSKPNNKRYQKFFHRSAHDQLPQVWQSALTKFSDYHPILYNGSLWTTTRGAKQRLKKKDNPPLSIAAKIKNQKKRRCKLVIETLHVKSTFTRFPHHRCYYDIKKETLVQINPRSVAQWRR